MSAFVIVLIAVVIGFTWQDKSANDNLRAACDRANVQRQVLYDNTVTDAKTRQEAAGGFTGVRRAAVEGYARQGFKNAEALVDANADVAVTPGAVIQDCSAAYPAPFPFSIWED